MTHELISNLLKDAAFSAIAAIGFSIISNPPKRAILAAALLAAIGHSFRLFLITVVGTQLPAASLAAALLMGGLSFLTAHSIKVPNEVFTFPSLLPMIPGMFAYKSILSLTHFLSAAETEERLRYLIDAFYNGTTALAILFSLVLGVSIPVMLFHRHSFQVTRKRWPWKW